MGSAFSTSINSSLAYLHPPPSPASEFSPTPSELSQSLFLLNRIFPPELSLTILNLAHYWPRRIEGNASHHLIRASGGDVVRKVVWRSAPVQTRAVGRARIVIDSRDQGWSSFPEHHRTRNASSSYFELGIMRPLLTLPSLLDQLSDDESSDRSDSGERMYRTHSARSSISTILSDAQRSASTGSMARNHSRLSSMESTLSRSSSSTSTSTRRYRRGKCVSGQQYALVGDKRHLLHYNLHAGREFIEHSQIFHSSQYPDGADAGQTQPCSPSSTPRTVPRPLDEEGKEKRRCEADKWIDEVREGDVVVIWAVARYAGWLNEVRGVRVELDLIVH